MARLSTEERKEQIAIAILEIIGREGLENLSMPALAKRLGIVPSALYRHFSSKEEMISASLDMLREKVHQLFDSWEGDSEDVFQILRGFMGFHSQFLNLTTVFPRVVFSLVAGETTESYEMRRGKLREFLDSVLGRIAAILERGRENGQLREDLDTSSAALHFWGILVSSTVRWFITGGDFDVEAYKKSAWEMYVRAVSK